MIEVGRTIGRYRVVEPIGRGGMGGVFHVVDESGTSFALKAPLVDTEGSSDVTRRFAREANAMRLLEHPNLVGAADVFVENGALFLVMERVVGRTLTRAIADGLSARQALVFVRQLLEGVASAHALGFIHRDLKPDNVLLADQGGWERVKIIDFGLVKLVGDAEGQFGSSALTRTGYVNGTPAYMAPEQALGRVIDQRADLYAVGVILYEALLRKLPFDDPDPFIMMRLQAKQPHPPLPDAPWNTPMVGYLVDRALAKQPADRFQDAAQMIAALDAAFASLNDL